VVNVLSGSGGFGHLWLYLVGPLAGGVVGAQIFRIQEPAG
jgi:glycerol uptake facilitator-like aquaporin